MRQTAIGTVWIYKLSHSKIDNPFMVTFFYKTHVFEWYVVWCTSRNIYPKNLCFKEIGLHAQNMTIIIDSTIHITWGEVS